jgi:hypothetical protein
VTNQSGITFLHQHAGIQPVWTLKVALVYWTCTFDNSSVRDTIVNWTVKPLNQNTSANFL